MHYTFSPTFAMKNIKYWSMSFKLDLQNKHNLFLMYCIGARVSVRFIHTRGTYLPLF